MKHLKVILVYIKVVEIFRKHGALTLVEFNENWVKEDVSNGVPYIRKTFSRHLDEIMNTFGIIIECGKKYKYRISNPNIFEEDNMNIWAYNIISSLGMFYDCLDIRDKIIMDIQAMGIQWARPVVDAIKGRKKVHIIYQKFDGSPIKDYQGDPYCLKEYNNTWYVLLRDGNRFLTLGLDRFKDIREMDESFIMDPDFDCGEYFENYFGVYVDDRLKPEIIRLRVYDDEAQYMLAKPWHHSQKLLSKHQDYCDFELKLCVTNDFIGRVFSRQDRVEILYPAHLREDMKNRLDRSRFRYK